MTTPVSGEAAAGARFPPHNLSLGARLTGVVRRPGWTLGAVAAHPTWAGVLAVTTIATVLAGIAVASTDVGRTALVDQWERTAFAFGREMSAGEYARLLELGGYAPLYAALTAVAAGPLLAAGVALLAHMTLATSAGARATLTQAFAIAAHAGVILALRQMIAAPAGYVRETTANSTALGVWFPVADAGTALGRFLGVLDVFVLWWVAVLAIGFGILYRRRARTIAAGLFGVYVAGAGLLTIAMEFVAARQ